MKFLSKLFPVLTFLMLFSCGEETTGSQAPSEALIPDTTSQEQASTPEPESPEQESPSFYVKAPSGLNYRKAPKGEVLGKFPFNAEVKIVERSGIKEEIQDEGETLSGEWVGVQHGALIVYVFDAFLNDEVNEDPSFASSILKGFDIFFLGGYETIIGKASIPFVSLTDSYAWQENEDSLAIAPQYLGDNEVPEYHTLDKKYRKRFMKRSGIKESDKVFIYHFTEDKFWSFSVSELPLFAHLTIYGASSPVAPYDYLIGFNLDGKINKEEYEAYPPPLVYVGKENPFNRGKMKPFVWEEIANEIFPSSPFTPQRAENLKSFGEKKTFQFKSNGLTYLVQDYAYAARHLMVLNEKQETLFNQIYFGGESKSLAPLNKESTEKPFEQGQWTGKLFKDKAPVMLGFFYESFGCEAIYLLDGTNKTLPILCDNRH